MPPMSRICSLCALCGGPLVAIGTARKNGKRHRDWQSRQYHKQCWAKVAPRSVKPRKPRKPHKPKWRR